MNPTKNFEQLLAMSILILLLVGSYLVLRPFLSAIMWAALLCYATWPIFLRLSADLKGRKGIAALLLCIIIALLIVAPFIVVGASLADNVEGLRAAFHTAVAQGLPPPPAWVAKLPLVGPKLNNLWLTASNDMGVLADPLRRNLPEVSRWLLGRSVALGNGILQLSLSVFILFFLYRDGATLAQRLDTAVLRVGGERARELLHLAGSTVKGVVYGILGTAVAQGILAGIGFLIAGVPGALLLGLATFFLSVVPVGPPMIWIPAAAWLYYQGHTGMAIFIVVWGAAVVSSVDNILKPILISHGAAMPFILVLLGVLGGLAAFGFVGVFLGPVLLAVAYSLIRDWTLNPSLETPASEIK